ncbi:mitochondrial import inner membrane translocase subunit Tim9 [Athene cunicularia]|uniref:mitochondrial import inner membrane translocase subunit Tim9 n=1 Tax=Athene cunicularia TaxID=194338 RepID=UPI000EF6BB2A|nr:mitochondrial import inner membrane translocase subunit Tim9 [Athene cunicularia]
MAGQISESDQIKQFKEFLGTYNKLTENCFLDCIKDFTTREVKPEEYTHSEGIFLISLEYWLLIAILCISFSELSVEVLVPQLLMGGIFVDMEVAHLQPASRSLKITCSDHCLQKYLKMTQRISMRFQEYHIQQNEALAAKAGLLGQPR